MHKAHPSAGASSKEKRRASWSRSPRQEELAAHYTNRERAVARFGPTMTLGRSCYTRGASNMSLPTKHARKKHPFPDVAI